MEPIDVGLESWVANLAARLQLDSPASARPPDVTVGAASASEPVPLEVPPLQSGQGDGLQQAGLQVGLEQAALEQAGQLQQAGLQQAGQLSALQLPDLPPQQQDLVPGLSSEPSDLSPLPSDADGLAHDPSPFDLKDGAEMDLGELEADLDELEGRGIVKRAWTPDEDASLLQLVNDHGPRSWSVISKKLPGRVGKQCRERYFPLLSGALRPPPPPLT